MYYILYDIYYIYMYVCGMWIHITKYTHIHIHTKHVHIYITKYTLEQCHVLRAIIAIICNTSCSKKIRKEKANMPF